MCKLQDALFSGPHQDRIINQLADYIYAVKPEDCNTFIFGGQVDGKITAGSADKIAGFYQQIALHGNALVKTFTVLVAMYIVPDVLNAIRAATPVTLSNAYSNGFAERFEQHLCGLGPRSNKLPVEIVLFEWQLFTKLVTGGR